MCGPIEQGERAGRERGQSGERGQDEIELEAVGGRGLIVGLIISGVALSFSCCNTHPGFVSLIGVEKVCCCEVSSKAITSEKATMVFVVLRGKCEWHPGECSIAHPEFLSIGGGKMFELNVKSMLVSAVRVPCQ